MARAMQDRKKDTRSHIYVHMQCYREKTKQAAVFYSRLESSLGNNTSKTAVVEVDDGGRSAFERMATGWQSPTCAAEAKSNLV